MAIRAYPEEGADIEREVTSGTVLWVDLSQSDAEWYALYADGAESVGYVKRSDTVACPAETLFQIASAVPKDGKVKVNAILTMYDDEEADDEETESEPVRMTWSAFWTKVEEIEKELAEEDDEQEGTTIDLEGGIRTISTLSMTETVGQCVLYVEDQYEGVLAECSFALCDAVVTRMRTGDRKTYGLVVASDVKSRVNLRQGPDKSSKRLGRYYTGTQVEVLASEGEWYRVSVNGMDTGYMMKEFVTIVKQEE